MCPFDQFLHTMDIHCGEGGYRFGKEFQYQPLTFIVFTILIMSIILKYCHSQRTQMPDCSFSPSNTGTCSPSVRKLAASDAYKIGASDWPNPAAAFCRRRGGTQKAAGMFVETMYDASRAIRRYLEFLYPLRY